MAGYDGDEMDAALSAFVDDDEPIPMEMDLTETGPPVSPDSEEESAAHRLRETWKQWIYQWAKIILPHVGLVVMLTVYTICGAIVFHALEAPNEIEVKERDLGLIRKTTAECIEMLWNVTHDNTTEISEDDFKKIAMSYIDELTENMFKAYQTQLITPSEIRNLTVRRIWTFPSSIFFATTVITTIGYGNLVPATLYGRMFCIVFGLCGIPLLLVTIADIGKFLSDFLSFLYRNYRLFKRKIRLQSRRLSFRYRTNSSSRSDSGTPIDKTASTLTAQQIAETESEMSAEDELRIPVIMVMLVLIGYTALGGLLFRSWEGWPYFDAFYFCFITMATIGFGDFVPTKQVYMFFTMAYIIFGLALATMCIDLAGTEYIRKIHYFGQKIEDARGVLVSGLHTGEHFMKHQGVGFVRTAGGKLVRISGAVLSARQARRYGLTDFVLEGPDKRNILYEPLSPAVEKLLKPHINVLPEHIRESDAWVVRNKQSGRRPTPRPHFQSPNAIHRQVVYQSWLRRRSEPVVVVAPFVLKESHV